MQEKRRSEREERERVWGLISAARTELREALRDAVAVGYADPGGGAPLCFF